MYCNIANIRICQEIQCLLYLGFFMFTIGPGVAKGVLHTRPTKCLWKRGRRPLAKVNFLWPKLLTHTTKSVLASMEETEADLRGQLVSVWCSDWNKVLVSWNSFYDKEVWKRHNCCYVFGKQYYEAKRNIMYKCYKQFVANLFINWWYWPRISIKKALLSAPSKLGSWNSNII